MTRSLLRRPPPRPLLLGLAAALGGALWGLAFTTTPRPYLGFVGLAALLLLLSRPRPALGRRAAAGVGFVHGLAGWLVAIPWILPTVVVFGQIPGWLAVIFLLLLCSYLAAFHAAFAVLVAGLWRRGGRWGVALWGPAALWVGLEWLRAHLFGGFPWNPAAYAWTDLPGALPSAASIGAYGVSFLLVLANAAVASLAERRWRAAAVGLLAVLAVLAVGAARGRAVGASAAARSDDTAQGDGAAPIDVRLVQPNIPNLVEIDWPTIFANYRGLLELSRQACAEGALVIWPESASWPYMWSRDEALRRDLADLSAGGCGVLLNSAHADGDDWYNSAYLVAPGAAVGDQPMRYDKRHLVPFGEYVPLGELLPWVRGLARAAGSFRPAEELVLLPWASADLGVAICFEIVFPEEVAELVQTGASVLVTITNDAWYGDTSAPRQHFRAARWRAAESRRTVLRAAVTGISGVIGPDGAVRQRLEVGERGVLRARVTPRHDLTPYSRAPWLVPLLCSLAALFAIFLGREQTPHQRPTESDPR